MRRSVFVFRSLRTVSRFTSHEGTRFALTDAAKAVPAQWHANEVKGRKFMAPTGKAVRRLAGVAFFVATAVAASQQQAPAAPITPGNLVIYRAGSGTNTLGSTGNNVFLDEYTTAGVLVQSIAMPATGGGTKLITAGNSTSEGALSISPDGTWIGFSGYNSTIPAASSISGTNSAAVPRVAGIFNTTTGSYSLTVMGTFFSATSPRGVVTTDGNKIWANGGNSGVAYGTVDGSSPFAATGTTASSTSIGTNLRVLGVFGNELYTSTGSGTLPTVGQLAGNPLVNGLPTGNTFLPNIPRQGGSPVTSRYGFTFLDTNPAVPGLDTMYTVDDSASSGGLWKYTLDLSGTWNAAGSITALTGALRGLAGTVNGSNVQLFMTGSSNTLWTYTDSLAATSTLSGTLSAFTSLATAATNTAFRGIVAVPVPEPNAALILASGAVGLAAAWRRSVRRRREA
jgi:hypothetical protein